MAAPAPKSIGLVVSSMRPNRIGPQVVAFVSALVTAQTANLPVPPELHTIDLAAWNLPFLTEPFPPAHIKDPANYTCATTRAWSDEVRKHDAFVFVMPQHNWGYPAPLKNALDTLFHEWGAKPALIVSYGGRGGGLGAAQLAQVLNGMHMRPAGTMPALAFGRDGGLMKAVGGEVDAWGLWGGEGAKERGEVVSGWGEVWAMLEGEGAAEGKDVEGKKA